MAPPIDVILVASILVLISFIQWKITNALITGLASFFIMFAIDALISLALLLGAIAYLISPSFSVSVFVLFVATMGLQTAFFVDKFKSFIEDEKVFNEMKDLRKNLERN